MKKLQLICLFLFALAIPFFVYSENKPKLHVCTMCSPRNKNLDQLIESCHYRNLEIKVLGLDAPFNFGRKITEVINFVRDLPDEDIVMFVDAYDVLVLADEETIVDTFLSMNAPIIFSAQTKSHPFRRLINVYPPSPTRFRCLNSGTYIGYIGALKKVYQEISPVSDDTEDEGLFAIYYLYHPDRFKLDHHAQLFMTLFEVEKDEIAIDIETKKVHSLITKTMPCVIHGNSTGQALYQHIYDQLFIP